MTTSVFPGAIDPWDTIVDGTDTVAAVWGNKVQDAIKAAQDTIGPGAEGGFPDVDARITAIENILS